MERLWDMMNYLFGVWIVAQDDVLYIEDRRPTQKMGLSVGGIIVIGTFASWAWLKDVLIVDAYTITLTLAPVVVALFFIVRGNFREVYVFNKKTDSYTFTRQSVLRKDVLEGSASQFRAVQIEKRIRDDRDATSLVGDMLLKTDSRSGDEVYMVALLLDGLLFGQSDTQILREDPPFLNFRSTENRIANAIGKFLNIPREGVVDLL